MHGLISHLLVRSDTRREILGLGTACHAVDASLRSLMGPNYVMHYHNANHLLSPGSANQSWHKDQMGFEGDFGRRRARPRQNLFCLYYPQVARTTKKMYRVSPNCGPTLGL